MHKLRPSKVPKLLLLLLCHRLMTFWQLKGHRGYARSALLHINSVKHAFTVVVYGVDAMLVGRNVLQEAVTPIGPVQIPVTGIKMNGY